MLISALMTRRDLFQRIFLTPNFWTAVYEQTSPFKNIQYILKSEIRNIIWVWCAY